MNAFNETTSRPMVLCVDDEPNILNALARILQRYGCKTLLANGGRQALDILRQTRVQVLICDEAMPEMRGIDVLREAKEISPGTARILLTAHCGDKAVVIPAINQGEIFRLISKPWDDAEIQSAITDALGMDPNRWCEKQECVRKRLQPKADVGV